MRLKVPKDLKGLKEWNNSLYNGVSRGKAT